MVILADVVTAAAVAVIASVSVVRPDVFNVKVLPARVNVLTIAPLSVSTSPRPLKFMLEAAPAAPTLSSTMRFAEAPTVASMSVIAPVRTNVALAPAPRSIFKSAIEVAIISTLACGC